jgi:hypothetical protein
MVTLFTEVIRPVVINQFPGNVLGFKVQNFAENVASKS